MCVNCFKDAIDSIEHSPKTIEKYSRPGTSQAAALKFLRELADGDQEAYVEKLYLLCMVLTANPTALMQFLAIYELAADGYETAKEEVIRQKRQQGLIVINTEAVDPGSDADEFNKALRSLSGQLTPGPKKVQ